MPKPLLRPRKPRRSRPPRGPARAAQAWLEEKEARWWLKLLLVVLAAGALIAWAVDAGFDWRAIPAALERMNTAVVLLVMALLPIVGFPISVVYVVAGAKFGPPVGLAVILGLGAVHLLGTHWVSRSFLQRPFLRFLERRGQKMPTLPAGSDPAVATMVAIAPALPYFVRNYGLALSGISLRVYVPIAALIYTLRSCAALYLGDMGSDPSLRGMVILGLIFALKLSVAGGILWWLRRRYQLELPKREA